MTVGHIFSGGASQRKLADHQLADHQADPQLLRRAFGQFATGVTVVSYEQDGELRGATVNSFVSVSLTPPLVMISIGNHARAATGLMNAPFTVNVLASDQMDVALHFAGRSGFAKAHSWCEAETAPRLRGTVAWFRCEPWQSIAAGDHILFLGRVIGYEHAAASPLIFHEGQFRLVGDAPGKRSPLKPVEC